jgi:hypothetical protein
MEAFMATTSAIYHNQNILGFNHIATKYTGGANYTRIERKEPSFPASGSCVVKPPLCP